VSSGTLGQGVGRDGMGRRSRAKKMRELPPLKYKGFRGQGSGDEIQFFPID